MGVSLINKVKYNKGLYRIYSRLGSFVVNIAKCFVKKDESLIVFVSFGGRRFDDSPRVIYERMLTDNRFDNNKLIWAFITPDKYELPRGEKVRIDTFLYYKKLLQAKVWITNSSVERGLHFKGRDCLYFNTWHGTAIKVMGSDINSENTSFGDKDNKNTEKCPYDVFLAQSQYDVDVFSRVFCIPKDRMKIVGLPRNDDLTQGNNEEIRKKLRNLLSIPDGKKVILYAPTFREYEKDSENNCIIAPPIDVKKWEKELGDDYVLLIRAHYEVAKEMNLEDGTFAQNVSDYPYLNELMIVSDILISDYSSIFFDYSIQGKPMLTFCYDYERYTKERGLYFDIREELHDHATNEDELLANIKSLDVKERSLITVNFRNKYVTEYGKATEKSLRIIHNYFQNES